METSKADDATLEHIVMSVAKEASHIEVRWHGFEDPLVFLRKVLWVEDLVRVVREVQ